MRSIPSRYDLDPVFNLNVPRSCPGVPAEVLKPRNTWKRPADYDEQASRLARMFAENFQTFDDDAAADVKAAGPNAMLIGDC